MHSGAEEEGRREGGTKKAARSPAEGREEGYELEAGGRAGSVRTGLGGGRRAKEAGRRAMKDGPRAKEAG